MIPPNIFIALGSSKQIGECLAANGTGRVDSGGISTKKEGKITFLEFVVINVTIFVLLLLSFSLFLFVIGCNLECVLRANTMICGFIVGFIVVVVGIVILVKNIISDLNLVGKLVSKTWNKRYVFVMHLFSKYLNWRDGKGQSLLSYKKYCHAHPHPSIKGKWWSIRKCPNCGCRSKLFASYKTTIENGLGLNHDGYGPFYRMVDEYLMKYSCSSCGIVSRIFKFGWINGIVEGEIIDKFKWGKVSETLRARSECRNKIGERFLRSVPFGALRWKIDGGYETIFFLR